MVNSVKFTTIDSQIFDTITTSCTACISIPGLITTFDGNYETLGNVSLDFNWNIPAGKTLTVKPGHTFTFFSKLTVNGKISVQGALVNLSENSLNITGTGAVIIEKDAKLNNGDGFAFNGSLRNAGSLVVYGVLNNKSGSSIVNNEKGEVSFVGTIDNDGTITNNNGKFYKSALGGTFKGKPDGINIENALFGTLSFELSSGLTAHVPKNTELIITKDGYLLLTLFGLSLFPIYGKITNNGAITITESLDLFGGTIINHGTIINESGKMLMRFNSTIENNGEISNSGEMIIQNGNTIENRQLIYNVGRISNGGKICNIPPNGEINPRGTITGNQPVNCKET